MVIKSKKLILFAVALFFSIFIVGNFVSGYYCWDYDDDQTTCDSLSNCVYHTESWGGWCEELNCWSLWSQTDCQNTTLTGSIDKNCQWKNPSDWGWCTQKSCWSFEGNQTFCENTTLNGGLNCEWRAQCNGGNPNTNCWELTTSAECADVSGCYWGSCYDKGCWDYSTSPECTSNTGSRGQTCAWNSGSSYCYEPSCWDYGGSSSNETYCENSTITGVNCTWIDNYYVQDSCEELSCWHQDYTNESQCENSSLNGGLNCTWDGQYCMMKGCWNYDGESTCSVASECVWQTSTGSGWCEEIQCWSFDTWNDGNETYCEDNPYNLTCEWTNDTYSSGGAGWCSPVISENCSIFTSERDCMDTYYCWWEYSDWMNASLGGTCKEPMWGEGDYDDAGIFNDWNPGCYIFDFNETNCNTVVGCNYSSNVCNTVGNEDNEIIIRTQQEMIDEGLNCTYINDSTLCNTIPALSTCCEWSSGACTSKLGKSCWDNADKEQQDLGVTSCGDVSMQTADVNEGSSLCQQIAGYPLYMPCKWNNNTKICEFKSSDIFGNRTQSFALIDNKKNCEAAGGKWIQEFYCEGNRSIPAGRCEQKGTDEKNCNKACFACEYDFTGAPHNSSKVAKEYCYDSDLGYCKFINDSSAPNGYGLCRAKEAFVTGVATDCKLNCGSCTYYGNPNASSYSDARPDLTPPIPTSFEICNTPKCYCEYAKTFGNVTCKWINDTSSAINGYCLNSDEKTCEDSCDRCYSQTDCSDKGRSALNASGSCEWAESAGDYTCVKRSGGDGVSEICWDGIDNDGDNLIDCGDSGCFGDSFCGFVDGDCFGWDTQAKCEAAQLGSGLNCTWVTDPWGSWCDFPGADCWKSDGNESGCKRGTVVVSEALNIGGARIDNNDIDEAIGFHLANNGSGWAYNSVNITNATGDNIFGNYTVNYVTQTITFANNTFMIEGGGANNITNVTYTYYATYQSCEWNAGTGTGWCEQDWNVGTDCYSQMNNVSCQAADSCTWTVDTWCSGEGNTSEWCQNSAGGWCDPDAFAPKNCWQYDSDTDGSDCNAAAGCYWGGSYCMEEGCWNYDSNLTACADADGCSWESSDWANCQVDWSATGNCWQFNESTCATNNCSWKSDTWGSWCGNKFDACWDYSTQTTCAENSNCFWNEWMWRWDSETNTNTQGACDAICYNNSLTESQCGAMSDCMWNAGWCMSDNMGGSTGVVGCWNTTLTDNETACGAQSECKWKGAGWCNPKGFGGGGAVGGMGGGAQAGMDCWKYDGNESRCTNSSIINISCMWMPELRPFCEPDWSANCWNYYDNSTCLNNNCWWNGETNTTGWCANSFDQCWSNSTLSSDNVSCNENDYCNWTTGSWDAHYVAGEGTGWCEPTCFSATTEATCTDSCRWMSGWCNTPGMYQMFGGMESGAPAMVAFDDCADEINNATTPYLDICGAGVRDMDDSFGFASGTASFADAGVCNNEKVGFGGVNNFGSGNKTVKYYVYLDTDGSTTGGCALSHDSTAVGYEFFFKYTSSYNSTLDKTIETFNAQKCGASGWVTADISLSAWKEKMCGEIQGPMIAVEKVALEKFPILYKSGEDMRVAVAIAGVSNNASVPSDSAGPGWVTPGAIDFPITGFFELGADSAVFEKILMDGGFVKGEDCFNLVDDDNDNLVDCNDWDCEFSPQCGGVGVNAVGYVDSSMPKITGVKVEEYTDAALIFYTTDKPANGTLTFWHNDSTCSTTTYNRTIRDSTRLTTIRNFTSWHDAHIYNDSGVNSLDYALSNDTTYYYKLQVCDSSNKCSTSACSSLRTAATTAKCGYCNFVTIISPPTGWKVSYDLDTSGGFEHIQGSMCGPKAGMKTNYSAGRKAHVKLNNSDGAEMLFYNVSLTKTGLTGDTRTINNASDLIYNDSLTDISGASVEMVGMISKTRDKIINNLHPEVCKIKIPNDDCGQLWHCDDNGDSCVRRDNATTNAAAGVTSGTSCLWTIPYCEF